MENDDPDGVTVNDTWKDKGVVRNDTWKDKEGTLDRRFDAGSILNGWIIENGCHAIQFSNKSFVHHLIVADISSIVAALSLMLPLFRQTSMLPPWRARYHENHRQTSRHED